MSNRQAQAILVSLLLAALPAFATTVTYTDLAAWNLSVTGSQTINFDSYATGLYGNIDTSNPNFSGPTPPGVLNTFQVLDASDFASGRAISVQSNSSLTAPYIHIVFFFPVTAASFNLFTSAPGSTLQVATDVGTFQAPTFSSPTLAFFGVASTSPITTVDISFLNPIPNQTLFVDNVRFGSAVDPLIPPPADAPEAATFLMIGTGLIGLPLWNRRRKRAPKAQSLNVLNPQSIQL
jgi:hypothetical protein